MAKRVSKVSEAAMAIYKKARMSAHEVLGIEDGLLDEPLMRIELFSNGLSKASFERHKEISGLDNELLAHAFSISSKTLQRKDLFDTAQSERMYELAQLYALGSTYFGKDGFQRWMDRPLFSIGNRIPLDLIDVSEGINVLKTEILRLQKGIAV